MSQRQRRDGTSYEQFSEDVRWVLLGPITMWFGFALMAICAAGFITKTVMDPDISTVIIWSVIGLGGLLYKFFSHA